MCSKRTFQVNNVFLSKYKHQGTAPEMVQFFPSLSSPFTQHKLSNYKVIKKKSKPSLKQSLSSIQKQLCYRVSHTPFPHAPPFLSQAFAQPPFQRDALLLSFARACSTALNVSLWCEHKEKRSPEKACRLLWHHPAGPRHRASDAAVLDWANTNTLISPAQSTHSSHCPLQPPDPTPESQSQQGKNKGLEGFSSSCQVKYSTVFSLDNKSLPVWKPCIFTQVNWLSICSYRKFLSMFIV